MSDPQRREFLAAAGIASLAALGGAQPAAGGDPSFMNNVPDPTLAGKDLPTFKFALGRAHHKFGQPAEVFGKFPDRDVFIAGKDGVDRKGPRIKISAERAALSCQFSVAPI